MKVFLRKKPIAGTRSSLFLDFYANGKRHKEYLNLYLENTKQSKIQDRETLRLADNIRAKRQLELENDQHGFVPKFKREANFVDYFENASREKHRSWHTTLLHLRSFANGHIAFSKIDEKWVEDFQKYLLKRVSNNSAITYCNKIRACLNLAFRDRIISENPFKRANTIKKLDSSREHLTIEELRILAGTPCTDAEVKRAFLFCCYTGLRFSDVSKLTWSEVKGSQIAFMQKKTGAREYLPLSQTAIKLLGTPKSQNSKVFTLPTDWKAWGHIQSWADKAGLKKHISFHVSRHTFAVLSLSNNVDIYTLSKLLGHTEIRNTQIYAKIVDQRKTEAVEAIPAIDLD